MTQSTGGLLDGHTHLGGEFREYRHNAPSWVIAQGQKAIRFFLFYILQLKILYVKPCVCV